MTLLEIVKANAGAGFDLIDEVPKLLPEINVFPAEIIRGTEQELEVVVEEPTVSARRYNEGTSPANYRTENRIFQASIFDVPIEVDAKALESAVDRGRVLENHGRIALNAVLGHVARLAWYGQSVDSKAFPGVVSQIINDSAHVIDATGTTNKSSVFICGTGPLSLSWIVGNNGSGAPALDEVWREVDLIDPSGKVYPGLRNYVRARIGFRVANRNAVVRIKNLSTESGKGLTDALMIEGLSAIRSLGVVPTAIFMSERSLTQLRKSRTSYDPEGKPAARPTDYDGVPIYTSTAISNNETV